MIPARCPSCGYTKEDAQFNMDHHLCKNAGNAPWERKSKAPFYWTKVHDDPKVSAPSGWYQWTERGLVYLGESILEQGASTER